MLRLKVFNIKKKKGLNYFFKHQFTYLASMHNIIIKESQNYIITKETILGFYIMHFKNIIIIHLNQELLNEFVYLYKNSNYVFDIYKSSYNLYHIFCISRIIDEKFNYNDFLYTNDCDLKWKTLTNLYGPCIIINKYFTNTEILAYIYIKTIGKGIINSKLKSNITTLINIANNYMRFLPNHYLIIHKKMINNYN
jgi:hypothetical protein